MSSVTAHPWSDAPVTAAIGYRFEDTSLLKEAMTHPSINPGDRGAATHGYERLEFLGDRVLGLVIAEWLLERFADEHEGQLAKRHTALVRREALTGVAQDIGLGSWLLMSSAEEGMGGRDNRAILADACEALIGALYLDGGLDVARAFIRKAWAAGFDRYSRPPQDPKTALQEWAQARGLPLPVYETLDRTGPDHEPVFVVQARVDGHAPARAEGTSKRLAAKRAAQALLDTLAAS